LARIVEQDLIADPPLLADSRTGDLETGRAQVLAEQAWRDLSLEPVRPPGGVLVGVHVDGAVRSTVVAVDLLVTHEAQPADLHGTVDGALVDGGPVVETVPHGVNNVHCADGRVDHLPRVPFAADDEPDRACGPGSPTFTRLRL